MFMHMYMRLLPFQLERASADVGVELQGREEAAPDAAGKAAESLAVRGRRGREETGPGALHCVTALSCCRQRYRSFEVGGLLHVELNDEPLIYQRADLLGN